MDVFTSIDWHPSLSDIVDNEFINIDRLERDSVMCRILRGVYVDPLKDLHLDNHHLINEEHINYVKNQACLSVINNKTDDASKSKCIKEKIFIPGIKKKPIHFPKPSALSEEQHALCLRVILKFSRSEKPKLPTIQDRNELQTYLNLQGIINQEQDEYLELAKTHWDGSNINIVREDLINLKWCEKLKYLQKLHKYYNEIGSIAFISQQSIHVNFESTVLETGTIPKLNLPSSECRNKIKANDVKIKKIFFNDAKLKKENNVHQDVHCDELSKAHNVDLVISSSGLKCLASNINPTYSNTWIIPIIIKKSDSKNIIYIDKPLPSLAKNAIEKNSWIYKYILKNYIIRRNTKSIHTENKNVHSDNDSNTTEISKGSNIKIDENFQYHVYKIGADSSTQSELMKDKIEKDYKILVRTKIDAIEEHEDGMKAFVKLAPKLEYQIAFGCEAVTLDEAIKQWITLTFTPNAYIYRVRIDQSTSDYLRNEIRTASSINNELKRLYNIKGENILPFLYNIIDTMKEMEPGRYLLRHTSRNGAFASVYRETENPGKDTINLDNIYCEDIFRTLPNSPWPILDKTTPTPACEYFNRMPLMFYPKQKKAKKLKTATSVK